MSDNVIEVKNVWKKFKIYHDKPHTLKDKVLFWNRNKYEVRWVLEDISFEVKKGESMAVVKALF